MSLEAITAKLQKELEQLKNTPDLVMTEALDFELRQTSPKLSTIEGIEVGKTSAGYKALHIPGQEVKDLMGLEIEMGFAPTTIQLRAIQRYLEKNSKELKTTGWTKENMRFGYDHYTFLSLLQSRIFKKKLSNLLHAAPHSDGGGLESVIIPATLEAYPFIKHELAYILSVYKAFGFTDMIQGAGVHVNVDFSLFGKDSKEQRNTMANLLWFCFINNDFVVELSQRRMRDTFKADMWSSLGDVLALDPSGSVKTFITQKNQMLDAVENGRALRSFNLHAHRDGRPALEMRWFGATEDPDRLMMMVEFVHSLVTYCKSGNPQTLTLHLYSQFVRKNAATYTHLHEYMDANPYSQQFMRLASSVEQRTVRVGATVESI